MTRAAAEARFSELVRRSAEIYQPEVWRRRRRRRFNSIILAIGFLAIGFLVSSTGSTVMPPHSVLPIAIGPLAAMVGLARVVCGVMAARVAALGVVAVVAAQLHPDLCALVNLNDASDYLCYRVDASVYPAVVGHAVALACFTCRA